MAAGREESRHRIPVALLLKFAAAVIVLLGLYATFWGTGQAILQIPDDFHDGTALRGLSAEQP